MTQILDRILDIQLFVFFFFFFFLKYISIKKIIILIITASYEGEVAFYLAAVGSRSDHVERAAAKYERVLDISGSVQ